MTSTTLPSGRDAMAEPLPPPRRPLRARVSGGHLLMLVAGLVAMLLNYHVLRASDAGTAVAVLQQDLAAGDPLTAEQVRFVEVTAATEVVDGLVTRERLPALAGSVTGADLRGGSLLRLADLTPVAAPAGKRAMSLPVPPEHAVAGALEPGDHVDVIEVREGRASYLIVGAPVLAVASPDARAGLAGGRTFSITLAVDDEQALRLALAINESGLEVVRATGARPPGVLQVGGRPAP